MAYPAERLAAGAEQRRAGEQLLPLRLPAVLRTGADAVTASDPVAGVYRGQHRGIDQL